MKAKTHRATAKRTKVTATGRILHRRANRQHKLTKVRPSYRRAAARPVEARGAERKRLRRLLNI